MVDIEQLGQFYLGRRFDLERGEVTQTPLLYDSKDLTTHAVCVGMTGSGKTGLGITLLEEAAIDGIPAIAIDPKGDLGNLLLTFPQLRAGDFQPWVDASEAARQGSTVEHFAEQAAASWRSGLEQWGQTPERIEKFRAAVDVAIYTPGSNSGLPLALLRSLAPPSTAVLDDPEAMRQRVESTSSAILSLLGVEADPLGQREHILLSQVLAHAWRDGTSLDMAGLIERIQRPGFDRVGVVDLETFYPAANRFELAMRLNNLIASPAFDAWSEGEPLDVQRLLYTDAAKPRLSIISIAHLSDEQRMFFVTLLLNEVVGWMRAQPGTSSLRAILYMDEVAGYFPATSDPSSESPMLTLLKQARAFGLGVVLATQNPVDLDYKALANAGTWLIGRLQTEQDKNRLIEGLSSASTSAGSQFDRKRITDIIGALRNRVFLLHNVHEDEPVVFQTRWALSYLRGPLTRDQVSSLMNDRKRARAAREPQPAPAAAAGRAGVAAGARPVLAPDVPQAWLLSRASDQQKITYRPALCGLARLHFVSAKAGVDQWREVALVAPLNDDLAEDIWSTAEERDREQLEFADEPARTAEYEPLPGKAMHVRQYTQWSNRLKDFLYRNQALRLWRSPEHKQLSRPEESEADFRIRLSQTVREARDKQLEKIRAKYASKRRTLEDRLLRARQRLEREQSQSKQHTLQAAITLGTSILGALMGRKAASSANVTRAATAMRSASRAAQQRGDIGAAEESAEAVQQQLDETNAQLQQELAKAQADLSADHLQLEAVEIRPRKNDITSEKTLLVWEPAE